MEKVVVTILLGLYLTIVSTVLSGCAIPLLTGVKTYQSGDTRIEFITGADFSVGMSGTDTLDNRKGINPKGTGFNTKKGE